MDAAERDVDVTYRRATESDLPRVFAVFRAALNAYLVPAGQTGFPEEDDRTPAYRHYLRQDGERFWVAEADVEALTGGGAGTLDAGGRQIVAWGCGLLRDPWWFLSGLFVLPEAQGMGIGASLFELAGSGAPAGAPRATVTDSLQPISNTLYSRRGLLPREALLELGGRPRAGLRPPLLGRLDKEPLTVASLGEVREIDRRVLCVDRTVDHAHHLTDGGRRGWLYRRAGRPVAYVLQRADGRIGPAAALSSDDAHVVVADAVAELCAGGVAKVSALVPAPCEGAQRALWEAGLVFHATPGLLLASVPVSGLGHYLPVNYGLF